MVESSPGHVTTQYRHLETYFQLIRFAAISLKILRTKFGEHGCRVHPIRKENNQYQPGNFQLDRLETSSESGS